MSSASPSLCTSCVFVRVVRGRRAQRYLLCRNEAIEAKYPRQPVLACPGYDASSTSGNETDERKE